MAGVERGTAYITPRQREENGRLPTFLLLSDRASFICCAIPKSGCTALKHWFLSLMQPELLRDGKPDVHWLCSVHHSLLGLDASQIDRLFSSLFSFAFVRDPLRRYASSYSEKFCKVAPEELFPGARELVEGVERLKGVDVTHDAVSVQVFTGRTVEIPISTMVDYRRGVTFREYVDYLCRSPDEALDLHWRPQDVFLAGREWDLIAPLDSMGEVLTHVGKLLGREDLRPEQRNVTPYRLSGDMGRCWADVPSGECFRAGNIPPAEALYLPDLVEKLKVRFAAEFELYEMARSAALRLPETI